MLDWTKMRVGTIALLWTNANGSLGNADDSVAMPVISGIFAVNL